MGNIETIPSGGVCTPLGFSAGTAVADIKGNGHGKPDFAVLLSDMPCSKAVMFTTNMVIASPVYYSKKLLKRGTEIWGVAANSGNANACTGMQGYEDCKSIVKALEIGLEMPKRSLLLASTGVIGKRMPVDKIVAKVPEISKSLDVENGKIFAKAIMTTDTVEKECAVLVQSEGSSYVIGGACKGAGMIDPAMATLLGFITTDVSISDEWLKTALNEAVSKSFNCITVDGDMSTNDTIMILANGMSGKSIDTEKDLKLFTKALTTLCLDLALKIVKDGEGVTKCVTIDVLGAVNDKEARLCARKIANSPLVKTMFAGCDPNWGRLMASAGASGAHFEANEVSIYFNDLHYVQNGELIDPALEAQVKEIMIEPEYKITIDLDNGTGRALYYTTDLTIDYIKINADYRS